MEYIYGYIKNIGLFLVFVTFIGIILPSGKYKNYIDLVLGLVLILIIVNPIVNFINKDNEPKKFSMAKYDVADKDYENLNKIQKDLIANNYKKILTNQIQNLTIKEGYKINDLDVNFDELTGEIYDLKIAVTKAENKNDFIYLEPVKVRKFGFEKEIKEVEETPEIKNIKNMIENVYNVKSENIYITVHKNGERKDTYE